MQELLALLRLEAKEILPPKSEARHKRNKESPDFEVFEQAWRFSGVDLSAINGVSAGLLSVLMTELGTGEQITRLFRSGGALRC